MTLFKSCFVLDVPVGTDRKLLGKLSFYQYIKQYATKQHFPKCVFWSIQSADVPQKTVLLTY
jgi:hypothetical protein